MMTKVQENIHSVVVFTGKASMIWYDEWSATQNRQTSYQF